MADTKFHEAQKLCEVQLSLQTKSERASILPLYLESLELQNKAMPADILIEVAEESLDPNEIQRYLEKIPKAAAKKYFKRIELLKIKIADQKGKLDELYKLISDFKTYLFEARVPVQVPAIESYIEKYFRQDFQLKLHDLAIMTMLNDMSRAENITKELILSCFEKSSLKGSKERLILIREILKTIKDKRQLEIYQNLCSYSAEGVNKKEDYKRIAEMVIYFDDFKFQILTLDLLTKLGLSEAAKDYAIEIKKNPNYHFPYLDKYFRHLKSFFVTGPKNIESKPKEELPKIDLTLFEEIEDEETIDEDLPYTDEEVNLITAMKFQSYTYRELIELAVSFLQSEYPHAALKASDLALKESQNDVDFLKACYLKLTSLLKLSDYRAALDLAFVALSKASTQDDILSFLYLQAEIFMKLGQNREAKALLTRISSIDSQYRLTQERLQRLDEI